MGISRHCLTAVMAALALSAAGPAPAEAQVRGTQTRAAPRVASPPRTTRAAPRTTARIAPKFNRATRTKSTSAMASELRQRVGKNRVEINTSRGTQKIDLEGRAHFDKRTNRKIETPHVHYNERGKRPTVREATKADVRVARRVVRNRQNNGRQK